MDEAQYSQLRRNQRRYAPQALFADGAENRLLRTAARRLKQRERVERVVDELVPPEWAGGIRVTGVAQGTVTLASDDDAVREGLRRRIGGLGKQLARRTPGIKRVRIAPVDDQGD